MCTNKCICALIGVCAGFLGLQCVNYPIFRFALLNSTSTVSVAVSVFLESEFPGFRPGE